ncbi:MAG TPA: hypothetical protein VMS21_09560, partial [Methylomirabilota bacterium]|nr:hypothetical protein [Methylomirabilota bacterium]
IVMKCLEKDRTRRYPTANDLAADLRRYLRNEPVSACPPAASYRLRKFIRRNKVMVGAATVSVAALLVASVVSTWQAVRATRAEREQTRLRQTAEEAGNQATLQRRLAEAEKLDALHRAYNSEMNLVQQAMHANNYGRVVQLLDRHMPAAGHPDFRQWEWRHFWNRSRSEAAFALPRQSNSITAIAVSPNGRLLASRDRDGALKLWDLPNRIEVAVLSDGGQSGWPGSAPFTWSRDGTRLATIASQGPRRSTAKVWTVSNREVAAEFPHDGRIEALAFSADDTRLLTLDSRLTLRGFDLENRRLNFQHSMTNAADESPGRSRREAVFSPDGSRVAVGDSTRGIRLFDVLTGTQLSHIPTDDAAVASMAFSPDGELLAVSPRFTAASTSIQLYSTRTGEDMGTLDGHVSWVPALLFMPDGRRLVSAGADQSVRLWDVTTRQELAVFRGHLNEVNCVTLTQDGTTILSGCKDGRLLGWDADNPGRNPPFTLLPVPVSGVEFFPDGQTFLTVDRDGFVTVWDSTTLRERERLPGAASPVNRVLVSNDGSRVFIGTRESGLQVLDWATRLVITNLPASGPNATPIGLVHEGRTLVVSSGRGTIGLWDTLSWKPTAAWQLDEDGSPIPAPIPSATAGRPTSPAAAFRFSRFRAPMALSPDGLSILIPVDDGGVEVRDLRSGELRFTVSAHLWDVSSLAWASDGNMFASASADGMVNLYDPASGEVLDVLRGHLLGVGAIAFSPDGRRLASSSHGSEAVKLWDVTTRHEVATLAGNNAVFSQVGFSPDGELLIAVNASGEAHVWRAPTTP